MKKSPWNDDLKKPVDGSNDDDKILATSQREVEIDDYANFVTWECSFFRLGPIMSCTLPCWSWQVILLNKYSYCLTVMVFWVLFIGWVYYKLLSKINLKVLKFKDRVYFLITYICTFPPVFYGFLILYTKTIHSLLIYFLG